MNRKIGIGHQDFETLITNDLFYIDKTKFIQEWWENADSVTLITRPRRFGKTLTLSMTEKFFSLSYAGRGDLFKGLSIWNDEKYRRLQGTLPVISLSFANVKEADFTTARRKLCQILSNLYSQNHFLLESGILDDREKKFFSSVSVDMDDAAATMSIYQLSLFLSRYYGKKVLILLDEYDTPMQEAFVHGYWDQFTVFIRSLFNAAFKTNPFMERALMTGITRVSRESVFSDLNNLSVITTTSAEYADCFGFTEEEVFCALDEYRLSDRKNEVKQWYDGFTFGSISDIYNPWSIINYLRSKKLSCYWANTSSNELISHIVQTGSSQLKIHFEDLLQGRTLETILDEQIVFSQLAQNETAIWSLLLACGYLKVVKTAEAGHYAPHDFAKAFSFSADPSETGAGTFFLTDKPYYKLSLTNREVLFMFRDLVHAWFAEREPDYNLFIRALLRDDVKAMNAYMNKTALATFSFFDSGNRPSHAKEPERFYHGFVLGLIVDLSGRYVITSNRESGYGRYDIMLEPLHAEAFAVIIEFKVFDPEDDASLEDTADNALEQIERQNYTAYLTARKIPEDHIRKYGFAFKGKQVLIRKSPSPPKRENACIYPAGRL